MTTEEFINKSNLIHNGKYDYSKVDYVNNRTKVCIICPEHGEFWQVPNSHLNGNGCPSCGGVKRLTNDDFIKRANAIHNNKYTYHNDFISTHKKVRITCPIHGDFLQVAKNHLKGQGCPECGKKYAKEYRKNNFKDFIEESNKRFGDVYEFVNIESLYINSHSKILIKCKKCGNIFEKIACDHLTSPFGGCQNCYNKKSLGEKEIGDFIKTLINNETIIFGDRKILNGLELDIFIPSKKIAIEYNGLHYHNENSKDKNYHLLKTELCEKQGIQLIHIFEDEWGLSKNIVKSKIKHILKCDYNLTKIMGRKCFIKEITYNISNDFLSKNHIQGGSKSSIYLGAFYNDILIGVMNFTKKNDTYELSRFATDINLRCQGVGGKLLSYFVKNYSPLKIISFADRRWTSLLNAGNIYNKLGFKIEKILSPDYRYYINGKICRFHKFGFRKQILNKKYGLPLTLTESEMTKKLGFSKIWDCGLIKYTYKKF